jgi:hypothetical protein
MSAPLHLERNAIVPTAPHRSAPSERPNAADSELLAFAQGAELAVHDLYAKAVDSGRFTGDELTMLEQFSAHHLAYAQSINGLIGKDATNKRNEGVYSAYASQMATGSAAYRTLQSLENTLVATHTDILSRLENHDAATLVASIITVEARQSAVFGVLPSLNLSSALDNTSSSIAPGSSAPVETTVAP